MKKTRQSIEEFISTDVIEIYIELLACECKDLILDKKKSQTFRQVVEILALMELVP